MKDTPKRKWAGLAVEVTERIVIDYANFSGRESDNRAEFRARTLKNVEEAFAKIEQGAREEGYKKGYIQAGIDSVNNVF
jgi:hypothetical protein